MVPNKLSFRGAKVQSAGNSGNTTNMGGITINISGAGDPMAVAQAVRSLLARDNQVASMGMGNAFN